MKNNRLQDPEIGPQEVGTLESIRIKILIQVKSFFKLFIEIIKGDIKSPTMIKIELTSEADLFFHYVSMFSSFMEKNILKPY